MATYQVCALADALGFPVFYLGACSPHLALRAPYLCFLPTSTPKSLLLVIHKRLSKSMLISWDGFVNQEKVGIYSN
jgi:hypothetical protein